MPQLTEELPPGTKICLNNASVKLGVVLLDAKCLQVNTSSTAFWHMPYDHKYVVVYGVVYGVVCGVVYGVVYRVVAPPPWSAFPLLCL